VLREKNHQDEKKEGRGKGDVSTRRAEMKGLNERAARDGSAGKTLGEWLRLGTRTSLKEKIKDGAPKISLRVY